MGFHKGHGTYPLHGKDVEGMVMWLGTAWREVQTMGAHLCWTMQGAWEIGLDAAGEEGEVRDGGPRKAETTVPGFAGGRGLARTGMWATTLGFARAGASVLACHNVGRPESGRGRGGARSAGRG